MKQWRTNKFQILTLLVLGAEYFFLSNLRFYFSPLFLVKESQLSLWIFPPKTLRRNYYFFFTHTIYILNQSIDNFPLQRLVLGMLSSVKMEAHDLPEWNTFYSEASEVKTPSHPIEITILTQSSHCF